MLTPNVKVVSVPSGWRRIVVLFGAGVGLLLGFALAWLPSLALVVLLVRRASYCPDALNRPWQTTHLDDGGPAHEPFTEGLRTDRLVTIRRTPAIDDRPEILN